LREGLFLLDAHGGNPTESSWFVEGISLTLYVSIALSLSHTHTHIHLSRSLSLISLSSLTLSPRSSRELPLQSLRQFEIAWDDASDELTVINCACAMTEYQTITCTPHRSLITADAHTPADALGCREQIFVLDAHHTGRVVSFGCAWGKLY